MSGRKKIEKLYFSILFIFLFVSEINFAGEIEIKGIYKGENLYVENPYAEVGVGFCVTEVLINDFTSTDEINSSFFEIDLSIYGFTFGELIKVTIRHKDGCTPRVLNKDVLLPFSTFKIKDMEVHKEGYIEFTTFNEKGSLPFIIEQYRWNKWVRAGSITGKGTESLNRYRVSVNLHSGTNKFRIKQTGGKQKPNYSQSVEFLYDVDEVSFIPGNMGKVSDKIFFSSFTQYEIYDYYGKRLAHGSAHDIDVTDLNSGTYFLNYDNKTEMFIKK
jgi:hypothetical protein